MVLSEVMIGDKNIKMACSADTPRRYRIMFGKDILTEMQKLSKENISTECIENLAYLMACQGDPEMDMKIGEWLDQFGPLDIVQSAQDIIGLWNINLRTASKPKKK